MTPPCVRRHRDAIGRVRVHVHSLLPSPMRLLLFDVDGTLLQATGGVHQAVVHAVSRVTGLTASINGINFSGRTDPAIFRDLLRVNGMLTPEDRLDDVLRLYVETAQKTIQSDHVEPLPGVLPLLSVLTNRNDVFLGLVTGNVEPIAYHKLRNAGLANYFSVGAFGSDHENRNELPAIAAQRASIRAQHSFSMKQTVVVGDTPHDIRSARTAGARAVAVSTGHPSKMDLSRHHPDILLETLDDTNAVLEQILAI